MELSNEVNKILKALSINNRLRLVGSSRNKNILYSADFDCNEVVLLKKNTSRTIQKNVKKLYKIPYTYVLDFKAGILNQYDVLNGDIKNDKVVGYNKEESLKVFESLKQYIPEKEYDEGISILNNIYSVLDFLKARSFFKYHILHWTYREILDGVKKIYGQEIKLSDAIEMKSVVKIDVVTLLYNSTFIEITCIYSMKKGRRFINIPGGIENIELDAISLLEEKNYYKYLKRVYSLARIQNNTKLNEKLEDFFNSKNGLLYLFVVAMDVLINMFENLKNLPMKKINYEIDYFKNLIIKYGKSNFFDQLEELNNSISLEKLSKLRDDANRLLQERTKVFLGTL
jgi:hypothetical protein